MGSGRWDATAYTTYASTTVGKSTDRVFTSRELKPELNPFGVAMRESRDSVDNPLSTPIIVGLDVTGSMGMIADHIAREGLGVFFNEILDRKPVTDPHLMFMGIGDANCDQAPLQVSQFEADSRIIEQLAGLWLEKGGGGNSFESYNLPWYFAANHTSIDSFEKRGKKGYLFTIGDEQYPGALTQAQIKKYLGDDVEGGLSSAELFTAAQRMYHVFHVLVAEGSHARSYPEKTQKSWAPLGQHVLLLNDYKKLSEVMVSAIQIVEGADPDAVAATWSGTTAVTVATATRGIVRGGAASTSGAVARF